MLITVQGLLLPMILVGGVAGDDGGPPSDDAPMAPPIGPTLTVTLSPDTLEAHVTASENGPVVFNGTASVDRLLWGGGIRVTVTLAAACDWPAIISPSTMVFSSAAMQSFCVTVVVPPMTSRDLTSSVVVTATGKAPGLPSVEARAESTVTVAPFYKAHLALPIHAVEARRGSTTRIECNLTNECNGPARIRVRLASPTEGVTLGPLDDISLRQGDIVDIELALDVASDLPTGTRGLMFQVAFIDADPGTPPSTQGMSINVVPELKGSGLPAMVLVVIIVTVAAVVLYLWRTRWSRPSRARHEEG